MFDQTVELPAVERTPGTVEVVSGLRLLLSVVVVLELDETRKGECEGVQTDTDLSSLSAVFLLIVTRAETDAKMLMLRKSFSDGINSTGKKTTFHYVHHIKNEVSFISQPYNLPTYKELTKANGVGMKYCPDIRAMSQVEWFRFCDFFL